MGKYDDHILLALDPETGLKRPIPRIANDGLLICGWCGYRVEQKHADPDAPWLCDDCGISRRAHIGRVSSAPRQSALLRDV